MTRRHIAVLRMKRDRRYIVFQISFAIVARAACSNDQIPLIFQLTLWHKPTPDNMLLCRVLCIESDAAIWADHVF